MENTEQPTFAVSLTVPDAGEALAFYEKALGSKELYRLPAPDGTVLHAEFMLGNTTILISPGDPQWKAVPLAGTDTAPCLFGVISADPDSAYKTALDAGCESIEEPKSQFWGWRTAVVRDPYGYRWNFRKEEEKLTPEEIGQRAAELFGAS